MANRHLFRSIVLQTLYQWDLSNFENIDFKESIRYNAESFLGMENFSQEEALEFIEGVSKKRVLIDEIIEKAAPDWPLHKINVVDRNILRLGMYELLFGDRDLVPAKVAINEAVELGKQFGGPKSGKFINGVIGAVYKELGEPGKDQKAKNEKFDIPYEEMQIDQKGAAVIYSIDAAGVLRIGMVHDVFGYWTLSKGGIEEGLTKEEGTQKKIKQETDWDVEIVQEIGENEYIAYHPERGPVRKQVSYFLAKSEYTSPTLEEGTGGLDDVRWFDLGDIADLNMYEDVSQMLTKSIEIILEKENISLE